MRRPRAGTTRPRPSSRPLARSVSMTSSGVCSPSVSVSGSVAIGSACGSEAERIAQLGPSVRRTRGCARSLAPGRECPAGRRGEHRCPRSRRLPRLARHPARRRAPAPPARDRPVAVASSGSSSVERPSENTKTPNGRPSPNRPASCSSAKFSRVSSAVGLRALSLSARALDLAAEPESSDRRPAVPGQPEQAPAGSGHAPDWARLRVLPGSCSAIRSSRKTAAGSDRSAWFPERASGSAGSAPERRSAAARSATIALLRASGPWRAGTPGRAMPAGRERARRKKGCYEDVTRPSRDPSWSTIETGNGAAAQSSRGRVSRHLRSWESTR